MRTRLTTAGAIAGLLLIAGTAHADTSYRDFAQMDENARILVIRGAMQGQLDKATKEGAERAACIAELFMPTGTGELALGYRTVLDAIEFDQNRPTSYDHHQTVEDATDKMIGVFCPAPL